MAARSVTCFELFNLLQAQSNWPSGGSPAVFDLRASSKRIVRGSFRARLNGEEVEVVGAPSSWRGRDVCLYDDVPDGLADHPVARALLKEGACRELFVLSEPYAEFEARYPFLCAKESSSKAARRPLLPSCILPGLLYLGDLSDAAALPRLREQLNVQCALTALAELPPSLKASIKESGVAHTWCNVRDVEEANIKAHFGTAYEKIEECRAAGNAIFIHCSRGVSRSASLCIAYLMRREGWTAKRAHDVVLACRPIVLPNAGFVKCLTEFGKELAGERTGEYAPAPKTSALEELDFELPPDWAADPTHTGAALRVAKGAEHVETLAVGEHSMYTFGRSLTSDFPLEHPSISRNHAALIHHANGGLYLVDLNSSHGSIVNGKRLGAFEATLLRDGACVAFGASSRTYTLQGAAPPSTSRWDDDDDSSATGTGGGEQHGPMLPGEARKRKWTPADAKLKRRNKYLRGGPKSAAQMSENERVARSAGSGSGCFGPGFG